MQTLFNTPEKSSAIVSTSLQIHSEKVSQVFAALEIFFPSYNNW